MALKDEIGKEITAGRLHQHWTTADLVANPVLFKSYPESTLRTAPPNYSTSLTGLGLRNGHNVNLTKPIFSRVGRRGRAILYALPHHVLTIVETE
jgi:hypothetical protein